MYYACYLLIQTYLRGNSRKNENYLARFMKIFQAQVGVHINTYTQMHLLTCASTCTYQLSMELGAEEVINEMLKDSM